MPRLAPAPGCMPACPNWGALSCPLFTAIHSQGPSLLSFVCFTLSIVDTHNRFIASLHSLYPEPISRRFIPFASLYGGSLQGAADKFHRLDFCHDAPRFNTTRRPWASLIEPPVPVHRACRRLHLRRPPHIHSALHPRRSQQLALSPLSPPPPTRTARPIHAHRALHVSTPLHIALRATRCHRRPTRTTN